MVILHKRKQLILTFKIVHDLSCHPIGLC